MLTCLSHQPVTTVHKLYPCLLPTILTTHWLDISVAVMSNEDMQKPVTVQWESLTGKRFGQFTLSVFCKNSLANE